jgi:hypothetical protein
MSAPDRCNKCGKLEDDPVVLNRLCDDCISRRDETAAEVAREMREESEWKNSGYSEQHAEWASRLESTAKPETPGEVWVFPAGNWKRAWASKEAYLEWRRNDPDSQWYDINRTEGGPPEPVCVPVHGAKPETPEHGNPMHFPPDAMVCKCGACEYERAGLKGEINRLCRERDEAERRRAHHERNAQQAIDRAEKAEAECERLHEVANHWRDRVLVDRPQWTGPEYDQRAEWRGLRLRVWTICNQHRFSIHFDGEDIENGAIGGSIYRAMHLCEGAARDYLEKQEREDALELHTCRDVPRDNSDSGMGHVCVQRQMALTRARDYLEKQDESDSSGIRNVHDGNDCGCSDRIVLSERRLTRARECARIARNAGTREAIGYLCDAIEEIAK